MTDETLDAALRPIEVQMHALADVGLISREQVDSLFATIRDTFGPDGVEAVADALLADCTRLGLDCPDQRTHEEDATVAVDALARLLTDHLAQTSGAVES